jgi:hypothetical protein
MSRSIFFERKFNDRECVPPQILAGSQRLQIQDLSLKGGDNREYKEYQES